MSNHDTTIHEAREWRNRLPSNLVSSHPHYRAAAFYDAVAHVDELLAVIEQQQAEIAEWAMRLTTPYSARRRHDRSPGVRARRSIRDELHDIDIVDGERVTQAVQG